MGDSELEATYGTMESHPDQLQGAISICYRDGSISPFACSLRSAVCGHCRIRLCPCQAWLSAQQSWVGGRKMVYFPRRVLTHGPSFPISTSTARHDSLQRWDNYSTLPPSLLAGTLRYKIGTTSVPSPISGQSRPPASTPQH